MPWAVMRSTSDWMIPTRSGSMMVSPGLLTSSSSGVVTPMMPMRSPRSWTTMLGRMRPESTSVCSDGSWEKSRLAVRNTSSRPRKLLMKFASTSGPKSNSWFPMTNAS